MNKYKCPHCNYINGEAQNRDGSISVKTCLCANKDVLMKLGIYEKEELVIYGYSPFV